MRVVYREYTIYRSGYVATGVLVSDHVTLSFGYRVYYACNEYDEYNTRVWIKIQLM